MMPLGAVLVGVLLAAETVEKPKVMVLPIHPSDAKLEALAQSVAEQIQTELGETRRLDVIGSSDLSMVLGLERERQLLGCAEGKGSCMAELSAAMGAPWVVSGNLARAGAATRVDLKLIRTKDGKAVWRRGRNFKEESEMFDTVSAMVKELVAELNPPTLEALRAAQAAAAKTAATTLAPVTTPVEPAAKEPSVTVAQPSPSAPRSRLVPWLVAGAGAVVGLVGAGLAIGSSVANAPFAAKSYVWSGVSAGDVANREQSANTLIAAGSILGGIGAATLASGLVWALLGSSSSAGEAPLTLAPSGRGLVVGGVW